eukprot:3263702-Prymnesium_polylepis.1
MELENFKSYYGKVTIGPFNKNMTSVVGPNGSGKSNVFDAMIFVFGFGAKQMRQSKVSDLIHDSEKHRNLPNCKVSVHFHDIIDLPDGSFKVVEGTELVVSREAKRDGTSTYRVAGKNTDKKQARGGRLGGERASAGRAHADTRHAAPRSAFAPPPFS